MDLHEKFEELAALKELSEALTEATPGTKFSKNMGHMVARNKQRTLQLKPYNYRKRSYENQEQAAPAQGGQPQAGGPAANPQFQMVAKQVAELAARGQQAKQHLISILQKAYKKVGGQ